MVVEELTEEEEEDVVATAVGVAASGSGSSLARFSSGLFEGQGSFVEYTPDPRIVSYLLSRKWCAEAAPQQPSVRKRRSLR